MEKLKQYLTRQNIIILGVTILVLILLGVMYNANTNKAEELRQAKILTTEQATNINALQNRLKVSEEQAEKLSYEIAKARVNKVQPVSYVTVTAPSIEKATANVQERIERKDPTLPPEVLEKTDRTVVAPQPDNEEYQVGVYKINLDKNNRIKAGVTIVDSKAYATLGYEQRRLEALIHFDGTRLRGGSVMYNIIEW